MAISIDTATNCRLIDAGALATEKLLGQPVKTLLAIMGPASGHGFSARPLSQYQLSRLLWASQACSAGSAGVSVYVAAIDGLYRFDPDAFFLEHVVRGGVSAVLAGAGLATGAPLSMLYVADLGGLRAPDPGQGTQAAAIRAGCCSQNVTLMCAAEGLATTVQVVNDGGALASAMKLRHTQRLVLAQAVGWPAAIGDAQAAT